MPTCFHGLHDDYGEDDVGGRRRQSGTDEPSENPRHQHQRDDVKLAELEHHPAHAVDEARDGEQADHDAER
jgi:hypothetical protein